MDAFPLDLPPEYEVIGECVDDVPELLLVGSDGTLYALNLVDGRPYLADVRRQWIIDSTVSTETLRRLANPAVTRQRRSPQ
jgi:hypothetical protein